MSPDHIEMSDYCLCDDCTRGYTLPTPRIRGEKDIEYALAKMKHELSGTSDWSYADYRAALGAILHAPRKGKPAPPRPAGENAVDGMSIGEWQKGSA
jgi:hypothetical protein